MSFIATAWAFGQRPKSGPLGKLLLLALANYADGDGTCWPGRERLAEDCGVSRSTIGEHIGRLEQEGFIRREARFDAEGRQTSNRYRLILPASIAVVGGGAASRPPVADSRPGEGPPAGPEPISSNHTTTTTARETLLQAVPNRFAWEAELNAAKQGMHGPPLTDEQIELACREYLGNGERPNLRAMRRYLVQAADRWPDGGRPSANRTTTTNPVDELDEWVRRKTAEGK